MFNQSAPVTICCDAPPYPIVRVCRKLGFHAPEDVRWCHVTHAQQGTEKQPAWSLLRVVKAFFQGRVSGPDGFTCRSQLPKLHMCTFIMRSGKETTLLLGQCRRCSTMFWQES